MARKEKPSAFLMYSDYITYFDALSREDAGDLIKALLHYFEYGVEPELDGAAAAVFSLARPRIDADIRRCEERKARRKGKG